MNCALELRQFAISSLRGALGCESPAVAALPKPAAVPCRSRICLRSQWTSFRKIHRWPILLQRCAHGIHRLSATLRATDSNSICAQFSRTRTALSSKRFVPCAPNVFEYIPQRRYPERSEDLTVEAWSASAYVVRSITQ